MWFNLCLDHLQTSHSLHHELPVSHMQLCNITCPEFLIIINSVSDHPFSFVTFLLLYLHVELYHQSSSY